MVNDRIKDIRKDLKLTQKEFAESVGMAENTVCLIENGKRKISEKTIHIICRTFDINLHWLVTGEGEKYKNDNKISFIMGRLLSSNEKEDILIKEMLTEMYSLDYTRLSLLNGIIQSWTKK